MNAAHLIQLCADIASHDRIDLFIDASNTCIEKLIGRFKRLSPRLLRRILPAVGIKHQHVSVVIVADIVQINGGSIAVTRALYARVVCARQIIRNDSQTLQHVMSSCFFF